MPLPGTSRIVRAGRFLGALVGTGPCADRMPRTAGFRWFRSRAEYWKELGPGREARRARDLDIGRHRVWRGFCTYCRTERKFAVSSGAMLGENVNLREGMVCPACGLGNRLRLLFTALEELAGSAAALCRRRVYLAEQATLFYRRLSDRIRHLTGSEYLGPEFAPGQMRGWRGIRHEDLCRLSFPDGAFDFVLNSDVLEHVPDDRLAFAELRRVTRPGGALLFTVPFLHEQDEDEVRARPGPDGEIVHLLPPIYHGNPIDPRGSLAYRAYGWSLLRRLMDTGFDSAEAGVLTAPELAFTSSNSPGPDFMEPVVFRAVRAP